MTQEPTTDPITDLKTDEVPDKYADSRINGQINLFILTHKDNLQTLIPEGVLGSTIQIDEEATRQKTVMEFIGGEGGHIWHLEGDQVVFLACRMDAPVMRFKRFREQDYDDWEHYAEIVWPDGFEIINNARRMELIEPVTADQ